jgi:hypothetical protein
VQSSSALPTPASTAHHPHASAPSGSIDPSLSDAGIAARVTISGDTNMGRDGTHDIYAVDDDGSECNGSFEEPDYTVVAWFDDAPVEQIHRFGITVKAAQIPSAEGSTTIEDGRLSFDFSAETGFGTQYTAAPPDDGALMLHITRSGDSLTFDFDGTTAAGVSLVGQLVCADMNS